MQVLQILKGTETIAERSAADSKLWSTLQATANPRTRLVVLSCIDSHFQGTGI